MVEDKAKQGFVSLAEQRSLLLKGWCDDLNQSIETGLVDEAKESQLIQFMKLFSITKEELNATHSFDRLVKAAALRDVMHGKVPARCSLSISLPLNLQKNEQFVWAFGQTAYFEDRTRREYVGQSAGVSVRVAKGVYFHTNSFQGRPVEKTERVHVDSGWFVVTSKNLYFAGPRKSMRIPFPKIVSFQAFSDGMGVMRDASSAKPQTFVTGDGWFTYNLVANLAKL